MSKRISVSLAIIFVVMSITIAEESNVNNILTKYTSKQIFTNVAIQNNLISGISNLKEKTFQKKQRNLLLIELPKDEAVHKNELSENYIWNAHLETKDGKKFGFHHLMFLYHNVGPVPVMVSIVQIIDLQSNQTYYTSIIKEDAYIHEVPNAFALFSEISTTLGRSSMNWVQAKVNENKARLQFIATKRPVFNGGDGQVDLSFAPGSYQFMYTRPRMKVKGTLQIGQEKYFVKGTGWFDHGWSNHWYTIHGWRRWTMQLDDNSEIMVMELFKADGVPVMKTGFYHDANGTTQELNDTDFTAIATRTWQSPITNFLYPLDYNISVLGKNLTVNPVLDNQEIISATGAYWSGKAVVTGQTTGKAFFEHTTNQWWIRKR